MSSSENRTKLPVSKTSMEFCPGEEKYHILKKDHNLPAELVCLLYLDQSYGHTVYGEVLIPAEKDLIFTISLHSSNFFELQQHRNPAVTETRTNTCAPYCVCLWLSSEVTKLIMALTNKLLVAASLLRSDHSLKRASKP
jgi:hypothetical protein